MSDPYWKEHLKPCPFCGAAARIDVFMNREFIVCDHKKNCLIKPDTFDLTYDYSLRKIVNAWNRRKDGEQDG